MLQKETTFECNIFSIVVHHSCSTERQIKKHQRWPIAIMNMRLQKEVIFIHKQPSCEKSVQPQNARVKKDVKSKVTAKKWL